MDPVFILLALIFKENITTFSYASTLPSFLYGHDEDRVAIQMCVPPLFNMEKELDNVKIYIGY